MASGENINVNVSMELAYVLDGMEVINENNINDNNFMIVDNYDESRSDSQISNESFNNSTLNTSTPQYNDLTYPSKFFEKHF